MRWWKHLYMGDRALKNRAKVLMESVRERQPRTYM